MSWLIVDGRLTGVGVDLLLVVLLGGCALFITYCFVQARLGRDLGADPAPGESVLTFLRREHRPMFGWGRRDERARRSWSEG